MTSTPGAHAPELYGCTKELRRVQTPDAHLPRLLAGSGGIFRVRQRVQRTCLPTSPNAQCARLHPPLEHPPSLSFDLQLGQQVSV